MKYQIQSEQFNLDTLPFLPGMMILYSMSVLCSTEQYPNYHENTNKKMNSSCIWDWQGSISFAISVIKRLDNNSVVLQLS
jgi:hypothetical protein